MKDLKNKNKKIEERKRKEMKSIRLKLFNKTTCKRKLHPARGTTIPEFLSLQAPPKNNKHNNNNTIVSLY